MAKPHFRRLADGQTVQVPRVTANDGLINLVANLGTSRDKASGSYYDFPIINLQEIINAYRGAWLPRKIVDIPALDATRAWREWQGNAAEVTALDNEEQRLDIRRKVKDAITRARLTGGAAIFIGTGDSDLSKPLDLNRIGRGGLKYLTVLSRNQLAPGPLERDVESEWFNKPSFYTLMMAQAQVPESVIGTMQIHPSRLAMFHGVPPADEGYVGSLQGWGEPVLLSIMQAVKNMDATTANVASLVFEAKVDTIGIPNLMMNISDPDYEAKLRTRMLAAETSKGVNGTLLHDAQETLGQKTATFSGLQDILDRMMQLVSGAADIPATRLLGQAPAGMNATGESDLRNYYDRVAAMQTLEMQPQMYRMDEALIRSALGTRPPELYFRWSSLWQTSAKDRATIGLQSAQAVQALKATGLIPDEPLAHSVVTMMTENGVMPGLEGAVNDWIEENPQEALATSGPTAEEVIASLSQPKGKPVPPPLGEDEMNP